MKYIGIAKFTSTSPQVIREVIATEEPITVNTKEGNAVIITEEQYNCFIEYMLQRQNPTENAK
jgi:PHD/YefM family antitoxin component YafN of YafNO toxin-antitoxin module